MSDDPAAAPDLTDELNPYPTVDLTNIPRAPEPQPTEEATTGPQMSDELIARAQSFGFSDDDLSGMSPDKLESTLDKIEAKAFARFSELRQQSQPPQQNWQQPPPPNAWQPPPQGQPMRQPPFMQQGAPPTWPGQQPWPAGQVGGPAQAQQSAIQPFQVNLDPSEYDEGLITALQQMNQHYQQQLSQIAASLQQQEQLVYNQLGEAQQSAFHDHAAWFDKTLSQLGDDFQSVFGEGDIQSLPVGSPQAQQRQEAYARYLDYLEFNGLPTTTKDDALLNRFVRMTVGTSPSFQKQQLAETLRRNQQKTIGRPTGRRSTLKDTEINPETGMAQSAIDDLQRMINEKLSV